MSEISNYQIIAAILKSTTITIADKTIEIIFASLVCSLCTLQQFIKSSKKHEYLIVQLLIDLI